MKARNRRRQPRLSELYDDRAVESALPWAFLRICFDLFSRVLFSGLHRTMSAGLKDVRGYCADSRLDRKRLGSPGRLRPCAAEGASRMRDARWRKRRWTALS